LIQRNTTKEKDLDGALAKVMKDQPGCRAINADAGKKSHAGRMLDILGKSCQD